MAKALERVEHTIMHGPESDDIRLGCGASKIHVAVCVLKVAWAFIIMTFQRWQMDRQMYRESICMLKYVAESWSIALGIVAWLCLGNVAVQVALPFQWRSPPQASWWQQTSAILEQFCALDVKVSLVSLLYDQISVLTSSTLVVFQVNNTLSMRVFRRDELRDPLSCGCPLHGPQTEFGN